jgi:hypothetical protein
LSHAQGANIDRYHLHLVVPAFNRIAALVLIALMFSLGSFAYSVLTHEEIVDLLWTDQIRPLLLKRYPELTEQQITEAHA